MSIEKVVFNNRIGIDLVGEMYLPANFDEKNQYSAIIVGHPFGGVKEQTAALYAQAMADRGYVALAFDLSFGGESGGLPRNIASPEIYVEDFSAAVDFLGTRVFVDREAIGVIGICGSGGFVVSAAQIDPRMKAIATVAMYDMGRARRQGLADSLDRTQLQGQLKGLAEQRWAEYESGVLKYEPGVAESVDADSDPITREFYDYYRTSVGQHPRASTNMSLTSSGPLINFYPFEHLELVSPRPLLFITGDRAHSKLFSEQAYDLAAEPKELYVVPGAGHVDLYHRKDLMPFEKIAAFFNQNLGN